jgi:hypothetical protein
MRHLLHAAHLLNVKELRKHLRVYPYPHISEQFKSADLYKSLRRPQRMQQLQQQSCNSCNNSLAITNCRPQHL